MQANKSKIVFIVVTVAILVAVAFYWSSSIKTKTNLATNQPTIESNKKTYSSEEYSLKYPQGYTVTMATQSFPALTIEKARNKRVEIFQMEDFGDRPWGFGGTETQEEIDGYVPKETLSVGTGDKKYDVWLFYSKNDTQTKKELETLVNSIIVR